MTAIAIRSASTAEQRACEELVRDAFWDVYRPGCFEHLIWHRATSGHPDALEDLTLVADRTGSLVGCIMSTRGLVIGRDGRQLPVVVLGPLAVAPGQRRHGIGAALVRQTLRLAADSGEPAAFLYGDPTYYARFGFTDAARAGVTTAEGDNFPDFMALELRPGALDGAPGRLIESPLMEVDRDALSAFDATFPPRHSGRSR